MDKNATIDVARLPSLSGSRNQFNYSKRHFTTFNLGEIVPIYFNMLVEQGDTISISYATILRTTTMLFPSYDNLVCELFAFGITNNDLYGHWNELMGENTTGDWETLVEYSLPQLIIPENKKLDTHDIAAHLAWPIQCGNYSGSKLGVDYYNFICNEYFNNTTVMPPVSWSKDDSDITYDGTSATGGTLRKAAKLPDYFNAGVPQPQAAGQVNIPIASKLNVWGETDKNINLQTFYNNARHTNQGIIGVDNTRDGNAGNYLSFSESTATNKGNFNTKQNEVNTNDTGYGWNIVDKGLNHVSSVYADAQASAIALNSLRIAATQQQIYEADAYFGTRARDIIKSRWGVTTSAETLHIPELLGYDKFSLDTYQVAQTSATSGDDHQGDLAAFSQTGRTGNLFIKSFDYWASIMILCVIRQQQHTYAQGLPAQFWKKRRFDFHWPEMEHLGFTSTLNGELYMTGVEEDDTGTFNYRPIHQEYRYERDEVTGEFNPSYDQSMDYELYVDDYDESDGTLGQAPVFSAEWVEETPDNLDRTLVYDHNTVDQFKAAFKFDIKKTSKLAQFGYPGLTRF